MALANGSPNFTPPLSALRLASAGASLPLWYGEPGDKFIGAVNARWLDEICMTFTPEVMPVSVIRPCDTALPWGWSPAARRNLERLGFDPDVLPSDETLQKWRQASSRTSHAGIMRNFAETFARQLNLDELNAPFIATDTHDALAQIDRLPVAMIKLPWSNSGRGQQVSDRTTPTELRTRINGMINRQGAVEITPYYANKCADFAMLWLNGRFTGYSLFETDTHGGWTRNLLASDSTIEKSLQELFGGVLDFEKIADFFTRYIHTLLSETGYSGPVGVDFIVADNLNGKKSVIPVEINLRRTMGHVAHNLKAKYLAPETEAYFSVVPTEYLDEPFYSVKNCVVSQKRLEKGNLDLVTPGGHFRFILSAALSRKGSD